MIIIIRGACGIGKTTISRILADLIYKSAHIEADKLEYMSDRTMKEVWKQQKQKEGFLFLNIWVSTLASALVEYGFHPIVDWMYHEDKTLADLICRLRHLEQEVHIFNLIVDSKEHLKRVEKRSGENGVEEAEMVEYFRKNNSWYDSPIGITIDTTSRTPEDVAREICKILGFTINSHY